MNYYSIDSLKVETCLINNNIIDEMRSFLNLKNGWDYGDGLAITKEVVENASYIFQHFKNDGFKYTVNPTTDGGIKITYMIGVHFLDVNIKNDLSIDITLEVGIGVDYETKFQKKNVPIEEIEQHLNQLLIQSCFLSERYTSENTIYLKNDLRATVLKTIKAAYPSSIRNAQSLPVVISVRI